RTDRAGRPDRRRRRIHQIEAIGISDAPGMLHVAAQPDREQCIVAQVWPDRTLDGPADREETLPVRSLDQLSNGLAGRLERGVQMPAWASPAEVREGEILSGVALRDVPGRI